MWSPLASRALVDAPLARIATELKTHDRDAPHQPGLLVGRAGLALFFLYYARFAGQVDDQAYAEALVGDIFETLPDPAPFSFCSGLAGAAWLLRHAAGAGLLEVDAEEALGEIDGGLRARMMIEMREGRLDYLHGALGCAMYLLEGLAEESRSALAVVVGELERQALEEGDGIAWHNPLFEEERAVSLGLSHGVPSVVSFLARCIARDVDATRCGALLDRAVTFLLKQEATDPESVSRYPAMAGASHAGPSRLAWCYGDPGVAASLWYAGRVRSRRDWTGSAMATLERAATRRMPDDTKVSDGSLCHGSAGLALLFARMHQQTGSDPLREAATYWLHDTLARAHHTEDGYAGFRADVASDVDQPALQVSMLSGTAGIGLALMALTSSIEPAWDRALLLS
jgi:lantibiotic biosynthesis protein